MNEMFTHSQEELILAGQKLRTVWKGYLVTLVTLLVTIVVLLAALMGVAANPFVGGGTAVVVLILLIISLICLIVGGVMTLVGLYGLRPLEPEYRTAVLLSIINVVLGLIGDNLGKNIGSMIDIAQGVISLAIIWLLIQATGRLMSQIGREDLVELGGQVWKITLACTVIEVVVAMLAYTKVLFLASISLVVVLIAVIVVQCVFLGYLNKAAQALGSD